MEMTDEQVALHFPVRGWRQKCGNRADLPKDKRVHDMVKLGTDVRNGAELGFIHGQVSACARCGTDKFSAWKGPKLKAVEKFLGRELLPPVPPPDRSPVYVRLNDEKRMAVIVLPNGDRVKVFRTGRIVHEKEVS